MVDPKSATHSSGDIYAAASACSRLFERHLNAQTHHGTGRDVARELWSTFNLWASFVGAFAPPKASLDARVADHPNIKLMFTQMLAMIERNLRYELDTAVQKSIGHEITESVASSDDDLIGLNAVKAAILRLNSISIAMRRSSTRTSYDLSKVGTVATPMDELCYLPIMRHRFQHASDMLLKQVALSIHLRGQSLSYQQRHNMKIAQKWRQPNSPLQFKPDTDDNEADGNIEPGQDIAREDQQRRNTGPVSETNPSLLNLERFDQHVYRREPPRSHRSTGSSIQADGHERFAYPNKPLPKDGTPFASCPICSEPLDALKLSTKEWEKHVNDDIEPYVCISEDCIEPLKFFASSRDWKHHMQSFHHLEWPWKIQTATWTCPIHLDDSRNTFSYESKEDLVQHLLQSHGDELSQPQILASARRGKGFLTRQHFTCPFCDCVPEEIRDRVADKPYEWLSNHIGRHLKSLAFLSLSYLEPTELDTTSCEDATATTSVVEGKGRDSIEGNVYGESVEDEYSSDSPDPSSPSQPDELSVPVVWPEKLAKSYPEKDETLEKFAAARIKETPAIDRKHMKLAIICALPFEADAVYALFDERWEGIEPTAMRAIGDTNAYSFGVLAGSPTILVQMPGMGKASASIVATNCRNSFPNLKLAIVVGICGGVPFYGSEAREIVLGDVIISEGLIMNDYGRQYPDRFLRRNSASHTFGGLSPELRSVVRKLQSRFGQRRLQERIVTHLQNLKMVFGDGVEYLGAEEDQLFEGTYMHRHSDSHACNICSVNATCDEARGLDCSELSCDKGKLISRQRLTTNPRDGSSFEPAIHFGYIASGDQTMKSGQHRDAISKEDGVIAFEMEGAGVWDDFPCLVVKAVCDYADGHKHKKWQNYAAAVAAACAKAVLQESGMG